MPFNYVVTDEMQLALVVGDGSGSFQESARLVRRLAEDLRTRACYGVIVDVRHQRYTPSMPELRRFAALMRAESDAYCGPFAIVVTSLTRQRMAQRFAELCVIVGGPDVRVFPELGTAFTWVRGRQGGGRPEGGPDE